MRTHRARVFGTSAYKGNPIALHEVQTRPMQVPKTDGAFAYDHVYYWPLQKGRYGVYWASREGAVWFCGHGALALTDYLLKSQALDSLTLVASSYEIYGQRHGAQAWVSLPGAGEEEANYPVPAFLRQNLGLRRSLYYPDAATLHLHLEEARQVASFDRGLLAQHGLLHPPVEALILSAQVGSSYHYRYLLPYRAKGEDPATGSAHIYLAPYYGKLLRLKHFQCTQLAPGGGGGVKVRLQGPRIYIGGVVTYSR